MGSLAKEGLGDMYTQQKYPVDDLYGPVDFSVNVSKRNLTLTNQHLWLKPSDTDWRRPIIVTLRELEHKRWG